MVSSLHQSFSSCIDAVEHEVHENLLQLDTVCHDLEDPQQAQQD